MEALRGESYRSHLFTQASTCAGLEALCYVVESIAPQVSPLVTENLHNPLYYQYILGMKSFVPVAFE
jgi:hypothetical protein